MKKMYGVITAMTTPFLADGEVDFESLDEQTEFLINAGVNCLYPCGTTGEMVIMTPEQREAVAERVVKKAAGRVIVFIHVGAVRFDETVRLAKHAVKIGADGIGVVTPSFFGLGVEELVNFYTKVAKSVPADFPVYMYNIPQCSTNDIPPEVCVRVTAECPNVIGIKYSYSDMHRTLDYINACKDREFSMLVGFDRLMLPALVIGCDGVVSGVSSVFPEPLVAGYKAYLAGDMDEARKQMWITNDIVVKLKGGSRLGIFKAVQKLRGLKGGHTRAPLMDVSDEEYAQLAEIFKPYIEMFPYKK